MESELEYKWPYDYQTLGSFPEALTEFDEARYCIKEGLKGNFNAIIEKCEEDTAEKLYLRLLFKISTVARVNCIFMAHYLLQQEIQITCLNDALVEVKEELQTLKIELGKCP